MNPHGQDAKNQEPLPFTPFKFERFTRKLAVTRHATLCLKRSAGLRPGANPVINFDMPARRPALVRLRENVHRRVRVPLWRSFPPRTESNCVTARWGGEQLEVNRQPVEPKGLR